MVAAVDGREPPTVAVEQQARQRVPTGRARLEVDEVPSPVGARPPRHERLARPEREVLPLARLEQEVVEPVERDLRRLGRRGEALPYPALLEPRVVADDDDAVGFGLA